MTIAYIALGSNLGDRRRNLLAAIQRLGTTGSITRISPVYETDPVGYRNQDAFLNMAVEVMTDLDPDTLLDMLMTIEAEMGRERPFPNAPRTLDLDLLFYGDQVIDRPRLTVPHPRLHERSFVLVPLADIAPDLRHPVLGRTIHDLLQALGPSSAVRLVGQISDERNTAGPS